MIRDGTMGILTESINYIRSAQGIISRMKIDYCQTTFIGMARFLLWAVKNPDRDFRQSGFPVP